MTLVKYIEHGDKRHAVVVRANYKNKQVDFFTDNDNEFQMGMFTRGAGYQVFPHKHVCNSFQISSVQEYILIKFGKLRIEFFTDDGVKIDEVILTTGDSVLTMTGGHGITFLEDTSILEIKQGPYSENKKVYF